MPGSLLISYDVHSDNSDVSTKSVDSRTSGKKVSFNKAVRVKQYPWRPDEYHDEDGSLSLPSQRFWFKVYKSNSNPDYQNSWNDRNFFPEEYSEDVLDSLTPIAEDDDVCSDTYSLRPNEFCSKHETNFTDGGIVQRNRPTEPPIDYINDERTLSYGRKYQTENGETNETDVAKTPLCGKGTDDSIIRKDLRDNVAKENTSHGILMSYRNYDFKRPTISSAAKCINEPKAKSITNKQITNARLPRLPVREYTLDRSKGDTIKFNKLERRSRSNDTELNGERISRQIRRADKAVSTDDLSSDTKENEENSSKNRLWGNKKCGKDKATQISGTLTKMKKFGANSTNRPEICKSPFSAISNQVQSNNLNDISSVKSPSVNYGDKLSGTKRANNTSQNNVSFMKTDSKSLLLYGKNFISGSKVANNDISTSYSNSEQKGSHAHIFEYDYVTDNMVNANKNVITNFATQTNLRENENKQRPFPWKTVRNRKFIMGNGNHRDFSPERINDTRSSSTIGFVRGRQMTTERNAETPVISIPKIKNSAAKEQDRIYYMSDQETSKSRSVSPFRNLSRERSSSSERGHKFGHMDNTQSMIDWSLSGFHLGSRDSKMSSSSDSECVVHRRPPLLMYIPGVSHHHRPALEDDRLSALSGVSRSEAEDDISPLIGVQNDEFKRRHSMPRNGKLNWLKWKGNRKNFQQL